MTEHEFVFRINIFFKTTLSFPQADQILFFFTFSNIFYLKSVCTEVERSARGDCRWVAGLNALADQVIESGRIIGYQIRWSNGNWSHWYIPGVNDLDHKYNPSPKTCAFSYRANTMRRMWSYFTDHTHKFIICKFQ